MSPKAVGKVIDPQEEIDELFNNAMKGQWEKVVDIYKKSPTAHTAMITKTDDTALHLAVADGEMEIALQLIDAIHDKSALRKQNKRKDTPLHLAAAQGDLDVCMRIVDLDKEVATVRNDKGETPIFLAALHDKEDPFFFLYFTNGKETLLKRENGDTILHVTVQGNFFRFTLMILHILYHDIDAQLAKSVDDDLLKKKKNSVDQFVNSVNKDGLSALHILASKSNAFKSSTTLGVFDGILYYCLIVDNIDETPPQSIKEYRNRASGQKDIGKNYPENYQSCMNFFHLLKQSNGARKDGNSTHDVADKENNQTSMDFFQFVKRNYQDFKKIWSNGSKRDGNSADEENPPKNGSSVQGERPFPPNYNSFVLIFKLMVKALLIILGVGISRIREIERKKKLHLRAKLVMDELVKRTTSYKFYGNTGMKPSSQSPDTDFPEAEIQLELNVIQKKPESKEKTEIKSEDKQSKSGKNETPILIAAKTGTTEMVNKILDSYPVAIHDEDSDGKNVVLLAVENRQPLVYKLLLKRKVLKESVFGHVDNEGNSALHLAAKLGNNKPWLSPGSALQMQWEIKWYEYVRDSMPPNFFPDYNKEGKTTEYVFCESHATLTKDGSEWLNKTSESCSVVAALVATVAFTASSTVPGGVNSENGIPPLKDRPAFNAFAISALAALCFSVTGLVFFLSILTSRYQEKDFAADLPRKLLFGLTSLFASIAAMLVSFCAGHIFVLNHQLRYIAYPLYAALCFPVTFFALAQLSLYFDLVVAMFRKVPQRSYSTFTR